MRWKPLLDFLATRESFNGEWQGWQIESITGGHNNRLFRIANAETGEFAIKFTLRDERNRARREFQGLQVLQDAGVNIAPKPVCLDEESYPLPVMVQTWIDGEPCVAPPTDDVAWQNLLAHYRTIHAITPKQSADHLPNAVLTAYNLEQARSLIHGELALIPESAHPQLMGKLLNRVMEHRSLEWKTSTISLCRGDGNIRNFLRQSEQWVSVDWEYSGWGDPAFEIAELLAHPAYFEASESRKEWLIIEYDSLSDEPDIASRIQIYYHHMLVWWCARFARYCYELPRGLDKRLAKRSADANDDLETKYRHYLHLAENWEAAL